jgi:hexosaminidase
MSPPAAQGRSPRRKGQRLCALAALAALWSAGAAAAPVDVTPAPVRVEAAAGGITVRSGAVIAVPARDPAARRTAEVLADLTAKAGGPTLQVRPGSKGAIRLVRATAPLPGEEAYGLETTGGSLVIRARTDAGLVNGAMTAVQLLTAEPGAAARVPGVRIADAPRFAWRGLLLDSARHYQSPAFIRSLLDAMALAKLDVLHWHLTDDQGWRLQIRKYPRLTEVGAWRVPAGAGPAADIDPATGKPRRIGGFYSQDEVRALVAYAAARHITIVPEIDLPGHASAAIAAYPQLAAAPGGPRDVPADWGVYPNLFGIDEKTFGFLSDVLDEVAELFPSRYIHLGGDEALKQQWRASPAAQAKIRELGLKDENALQGWFLTRLEQHLKAKGRRVVGWDEVVDNGLPAETTVMSWRGIAGAIAAARTGHDTILSPAPVLYFDNLQTPSLAEPPGRGWLVRLQDVYAFDPAPVQLTADEQRHVLGLQGNLWTEHVRTEARAAHMAFPRALAVAEVGWSQPERRDFADFDRRARADVARLRRMGFPAAETPWRADPPPPPDRRESRQLQTCTSKLNLALEDDAPVNGPRAIFLTDIMNPCWIWPQAGLDGVTSLTVDVGQLPFNFQIGEDVQKIPLYPPRTASGELEVRLDGCQGEPAAIASLAPALANPAVTRLQVALPPTAGAHDLCLRFTRASVDPIWAVSAVQLEKGR